MTKPPLRSHFSKASILAAALLIGLAWPVHAQNQSLIFVGDQDYPPITYLENGEAKGLYVEIGQAVAKMNREVEIRLLDWGEAQKMVLDGRADAADGMAITDSRKQLYDFSEAIMDLEYTFFLKSDGFALSSIESARGKKIGVTKGGYPMQVLKAEPEIALVEVSNYLDGFALLKSGDIDALAADKWVAGYIIEKEGVRGITTANESFAKRQSAIAVKKGNAGLLAEINKAVAQVRAIDLEEIQNRWISKQVLFLSQESVLRYGMTAALSLMAVLLTILTIWLLTLRKTLKQRRKAELALMASEERFRILFENAPEAIVIFDPGNFEFVDANTNAERLFGVNREALLKMDPRATYPENGNAGMSAEDNIRTLSGRALAGEEVTFEREFVNASGETFYCEVRLVALPSESRNLVRASYIDISERKRAEDAVRKLNIELDKRVAERTSQLEFANRELREALILQKQLQEELVIQEKIASILPMSTVLAHEMNTPVGNIITASSALVSSTEIMKRKIGKPMPRAELVDFLDRTEEISEMILKSGNTAVGLISSYKSVMIDTSAAMRYVFSVRGTAEDAISILRSRLDLTSLEMHIEIESELMIDSYPALLQQVFEKLIENAVTHAFEGRKKGKVSIEAMEIKQEGLTVVSINDDGVGIPAANQRKIFEPFFTTKMAKGGSGLGLTVAYNIVTNMLKGKIDLKSEMGKGSSFILSIPSTPK